MAQTAAAFRFLAHDLHALAALVEEGGLVQGLPGPGNWMRKNTANETK